MRNLTATGCALRGGLSLICGLIMFAPAIAQVTPMPVSLPKASTEEPKPLSKGDRAYLRRVAKDTWHCIAGMAQPETGLPYDNASHAEFTSVSNIGLYLSSVVVARKMGFISKEEADQRLDKTLDSLEKLKTWFGFQQSWNSVENLKPSTSDPWISVLDSGNLAASIVAVAHASTNHSDRCMKLFNAMDWTRFYDADQKALIGGYNAGTGEFNVKWHLNLLASDALLAQFFAVAAGKMPANVWGSFDRSTQTQDGATFLHPGWEGGGLFMQCISGLWLDTNGMIVGRSAENFAYSQIQHAQALKAPVWGWSACDNPSGGYLGWGGLKDEVVTPHASVLAVQWFPTEVVANLHALEALGVRSKSEGFYDSVNWKTGLVSKQFLVLDQGMLLLSLANCLEGDVVRKWFGKDPMVKRGQQAVKRFLALDSN